MIKARVRIEAMLAEYESKYRIATKLVERRPNLNDGRVMYWKGKAEVCKEVLALLDNEASRLAQIMHKELGGL